MEILCPSLIEVPSPASSASSLTISLAVTITGLYLGLPSENYRVRQAFSDYREHL